MEKLSIIIPVRDRADLLRRCLQSVAAQTYRPLQVIVVDNGSTDGSARVAAEWGKQVSAPNLEVKVLSEPRPAAARARSHGAAAADGSVLAFVDSDDTLRPDYAASIVAAFASEPKAELVFWRKICNFTDGHRRQLRFCRSLSMGKHVAHGILNTLGCAVRPALYLRAGGWNVTLRQWDDWELGIRYLTALQGSAVRIDRVLVDIYAQADSLTGTGFLEAAGRWEQAIDAAAEHTRTLPEAQANSLLRLLAFKRTILAALYAREGDGRLGAHTLKDALASVPGGASKSILKMVFAYTRRGLRGAASWALPLLKCK